MSPDESTRLADAFRDAVDRGDASALAGLLAKDAVLYTDGGDNRSSLMRGELLDLLKASDATVYAIGALEHQSASTRHEQRAILQQIAEITGGQAFFPTVVKELDAVYGKVVAEIRAQYTLGYVSTNPKADGAWRKVEVKVRKAGRDLKVRSRRGYFAPARTRS